MNDKYEQLDDCKLLQWELDNPEYTQEMIDAQEMIQQALKSQGGSND